MSKWLDEIKRDAAAYQWDDWVFLAFWLIISLGSTGFALFCLWSAGQGAR